MHSIRLLASILVFSSLVGLCFGQVSFDDDNWLKGLGTEADTFPWLAYSSRFPKEDLTKAKQRLENIRGRSEKDDWEGIYASGTIVGDSRLIWNADSGFFRFYFYHHLRTIDYGAVADSPAFVELISEMQNGQAAEKLIKVAIGERRFLVPEKRLLDFCERAAGLSPDPEDFQYYWQKEDDSPMFGLPILPSGFRHFLRKPIEARIIRIGKKKIIQRETDSSGIPVRIDVGRNKDAKVGMNFFVEALNEWIEITRVLRTTSDGLIRRGLRGECLDAEGGNGSVIPCRRIRVGMKVETKRSEAYF